MGIKIRKIGYISRKNRVWYPGATYHVMSRGNRKTVLYKDTSDYLRFLECIVMAKEQFGFKIHSICLMTNHFHMSVETQDKELWKIMQTRLWQDNDRTAYLKGCTKNSRKRLHPFGVSAGDHAQGIFLSKAQPPYRSAVCSAIRDRCRQEQRRKIHGGELYTVWEEGGCVVRKTRLEKEGSL